MKIDFPTTQLQVPGSAATGGGAGHGGFAEAIGAAISQVESSQKSASAAAVNFLSGGQGDVYTVALASQRADLSFEMFQQVRNKFVQAYQEIMRMQM